VQHEKYVLPNDNPLHADPPTLLVGDSKGVFDNMPREHASEDKDCALTMALVKQHARELSTRPRWVPHNRNPADPQTKHRGAHATSLMELLISGYLRLAPESEELAAKQSEKESKGYASRPKTGVRGAAKALQNLFQGNPVAAYRDAVLSSLASVLEP